MTGRHDAEQVLEQMAAEVAAMQSHIAKNEAMHTFGVSLLLEMQRAGIGNSIVTKAFETSFDLAVMGGMKAGTPEEKSRAQRCTAQLELMRTEWEKGLPHKRPVPDGLHRWDLVPKERVSAEWPRLAAILAPAVRQSPGQTLEGLRRRLEAGADHLFEVRGGSNCLVVLELTGDLTCWVKYLAGTIEGGPKVRIQTLQDGLAHLERQAKASGCVEVRLCGRAGWARLFPEYLPRAGGHPNELRKAL